MANRPKPREVKAAKGTLRANREPKAVPTRVAGIPNPPSTLSAEARTCWQRVTKLLAKRGQLSADSYWQLVAFCECWAEWMVLQADIREHGRTQKVKTKAGSEEDGEAGYMERQRPQVAMLQDADRRLKGWLIEFGLTDASRGKVSATPPDDGEETDPLAAYGLN
jgi:P27 family predicted phage terminase small subunit